MTIYKQTNDDCWRISLCNLLQLPPKKVPHFVKRYGDNFVKETRKWLNRRNKALVYVAFNEFLDSHMNYNHSMFPQGKCIAVLKPRKHKQVKGHHACFMCNGILLETSGNTYKTIIGYFIVYNL